MAAYLRGSPISEMLSIAVLNCRRCRRLTNANMIVVK